MARRRDDGRNRTAGLAVLGALAAACGLGGNVVDRAGQLRLQPLVDAVFARPEALEKLRSLPERERWVPTTDTPHVVAWREGTTLVAVLDEDGDLGLNAPEPDRDNDCWAADYRGDGRIDRVVDYLDDDGDGDADFMVLYGLTATHWSASQMTCVVIADVDDDDRFWHLVGYQYLQGSCQWECDFDGDNWFAMGRYDEGSARWLSQLENPFCFYDPDGDGRSEVALRIRAEDLALRSLRYSFDADNDTMPENPRDYDVSLTALGRVQAPDEAAATFTLRDGRPLRFLSWGQARDVAPRLAWSRVMLAWDELDHNVNGGGRGEREHERWEGVIAPGSRLFPQEGGPAINGLNTRCEVDNDNSGTLGLYYWELDQRLHLRGAEQGWCNVDWDLDGKLDLRLRWEDTDGDGLFDTRQVDADGDGTFDQAVTAGPETTRPVALSWDAIVACQRAALDAADQRHEAELPRLQAALEGWTCPVETCWSQRLEREHYAGAKLHASRETRRYYHDLSRESYRAELRRRGITPVPGDELP